MTARYLFLVMHYNFIKNINSLSSKHRTIEFTQNQGSTTFFFHIYMWFFKIEKFLSASRT